MSGTRSPDDSPVDSELDRGKIGAEYTKEEVEEDEEKIGNDVTPRSARESRGLQPPLAHTRSHSSARSTRSYTDGYSHFDPEEKQAENGHEGAGTDESREFEVGFDGDSDPWNPKNRTTIRKWVIVLIGKK
jgi:hypothetical protein